MVQSSVMSAVQFLFRIALEIRERLQKRPPQKRLAPPPPAPSPTWMMDDLGFTEYRGVSTSLKPILPLPPMTQKIEQTKEGSRAYLIWRDVVSPNYFNDLRAMLGIESQQKSE